MYRLSDISYSNFRYVTADEQPFYVCMQQSGFPVDLVLLDGPNGYGKTTLYDAIELLLTGHIAHFKKDLPNRGQDTYATLKYDITQDIVIKGVMIDDDGKRLDVKLTWQSEDNYFYQINGADEKQDILMKLLDINKEFFNVGVYISQSESLSFLTQKYNARRSQIAGLLGDDHSEQKARLEDVLNIFRELRNEKEMEYKMVFDGVSELLSHLKEKDALLPSTAEGEKENLRLFPEREDLAFDLSPNEELGFSAYNEALKQIEMIIENYDTIITMDQNSRIDSIIKQESRKFWALYEKESLSLLQNNRKELELVEALQSLTAETWENSTDLQYDQWSAELLPRIGISADIIGQMKALLQTKWQDWKKLGKNQQLLEKLDKSRQSLWEHYNGSTNVSLLPENMCPLCGRPSEQLNDLFMETGAVLRLSEEEHRETYIQVSKQWMDCWTNLIARAIQAYQTLWAKLYPQYIRLKDLFSLKTEQLEIKLQEAGESSFTKSEGESFEVAFDNLKARLTKKKVPMECLLSAVELHQCRQLLDELYHNEKPFHTGAQIQAKRNWLAEWFRNHVAKQLIIAQKNVDVAKAQLETYQVKANEKERILNDVFLDKYKSAIKDYNSKMLETLRLPIFLYSGRILQNHPLGLGIRLEINNTQLVFRAEARSESDVYNQLSTGQLNGLAISVLLAVHDICSQKHNLDLLMIDDPLQTIDEISAISLADMLASSSISGQIILSTHENAKADLIWYKFKQKGKRISEIDMQQRYLTRHSQSEG